jgi:hypothetical protein
VGLWLLLGRLLLVLTDVILTSLVMRLLLRWHLWSAIIPSLEESGEAKSGKVICRVAVFCISGCLVGGAS